MTEDTAEVPVVDKEEEEAAKEEDDDEGEEDGSRAEMRQMKKTLKEVKEQTKAMKTVHNGGVPTTAEGIKREKTATERYEDKRETNVKESRDEKPSLKMTGKNKDDTFGEYEGRHQGGQKHCVQ